MLRNIELGREKALNIVYLKAISSLIQVKMIVLSCLFGKMRNLRHIIPFLMILLLLAVPNIFWAQEADWPWVFDGQNFAITNSLEDSFFPSIASNGQLYFVVWCQKTESGFDIFGARIAKGGHFIDEAPIRICTAEDDQMYPSVEWDGESFFVVWQDRRSGIRWDIYGARVKPEADPEEAVLDPDGIPIAVGRSSHDQVSPTLSFDGKNYLVVWQGKRNSKTWNIYLSMVSKNGEVINQKPVALAPFSKDQVFPAVSFNGYYYFVAWQERRSNQFWGIAGAIVLPLGEIGDSEKIKISVGEKIQISPAVDEKIQWDRWRPEISWDGRTHLITWISQREKDQWSIESKRFDPIFRNMDPEDLVLESDSASNVFPAVMWDDQKEEYLLFWEDDAAGKIYGTSLRAESRPFLESDAVEISASDANNPSMPKVSRIEDKILVIWHGTGPGGNWQVYGQRLKREVEPIPPPPEINLP